MLPELRTVKIGEPAQRALQAFGIETIEQLRDYSEKEILALHGVGPKAIRILKEVLSGEGLSFKKEAALTIYVKVTEAVEVKGTIGEAVMLFFNGTVDCDNFKGVILPGGIDTQKQINGLGRDLSARYILEGVDKAGKKCKIFIENNGIVESDGRVEKTTPRIFTDSAYLSFLETSKLEGTIEIGGKDERYILIKIFVCD